MDPASEAPHVIIFPLPLQGPINSMLKLAELLCIAGLRVTFLNTLHNHRRLLRFSSAASRFSRFPLSFRFHTLSDGLPEHHPRSADTILEIVTSLAASAKPFLKDLLAATAPTTVVIASDGVFGFATDVAAEFGIPIFYFATISPCCLWIYLCLPKIINSGDLPFTEKDGGMDVPIRSVPGMEGFLRRRDLPSFCRGVDVSDLIIQLVSEEAGNIERAQGVILDTFEELHQQEPTNLLSHMRTLCPNLYPIGPLHLSLTETASFRSTGSRSNSLWEEDSSCIAWLDAQPPRSVVYVSIGSLAVMSAADATELWHGLLNSGKRFLWVRRPGSVGRSDGEDDGGHPVLKEGIMERGYVVRWAPQEAVLGHVAVGAFLTHSGWNSTLESIGSGVPMICWPHMVDQQINSRYAEHVWGLGLDMKDRCERFTVERMVRDVMEARTEQFRESARKVACLARSSVREGGLSHANMNRLFNDLRINFT